MTVNGSPETERSRYPTGSLREVGTLRSKRLFMSLLPLFLCLFCCCRVDVDGVVNRWGLVGQVTTRSPLVKVLYCPPDFIELVFVSLWPVVAVAVARCRIFCFFFVFCSLLPSCTEFPRSYEVIDYGPFSFCLIGPLALTTNGGSTYNECQRFQKSKQMKATSH